ncbi:MAG: hypothetical protein C9356_20205 [Oleiphilus sp.]|nr:MAG: hypothetical protein C9356_20205 [Oleiphilus sp.]
MIEPGREYYFLKSGNRVRAIEATRYSGAGHWVVERTAGASKGKRMIVHERSLVSQMSEAKPDGAILGPN